MVETTNAGRESFSDTPTRIFRSLDSVYSTAMYALTILCIIFFFSMIATLLGVDWQELVVKMKKWEFSDPEVRMACLMVVFFVISLLLVVKSIIHAGRCCNMLGNYSHIRFQRLWESLKRFRIVSIAFLISVVLTVVTMWSAINIFIMLNFISMIVFFWDIKKQKQQFGVILDEDLMN